jgi:hypothetical protein
MPSLRNPRHEAFCQAFVTSASNELTELTRLRKSFIGHSAILGGARNGLSSPGKDKEANWLPAPDGDFWVVFRIYGPGPKIVDQTWKMPPLEKTK